MDTVLDNPYDVLGVDENASEQDIRSAYRAAAKRYHPDAGLSADPDRFDAVTQAFNVLRDPSSRAQLDAWLAAERSRTASSEQQSDTAASDGDRTRKGDEQRARSGQPYQWWTHHYPGRDRAPWSPPSGPTFQWADRFGEQSDRSNIPAAAVRATRPPRERFALFGKPERRHLVPALAAGVIVAAFYALLAMFRFDPGMTVGVKNAAASIGPFHVAAAFLLATLVAWSAMAVRPKQRAAVVASSVFVAGGAAMLTVVQSAAMLGVIAFVVFVYAASHSRPRL